MLEFDKDNFPKNFCSVPWLQIHTEPDGKVFPCCYYSHEPKFNLGNWKNHRITDIFNGKKFDQLRKDFLDDKRPEACNRCWKEEDSGITSMRQRFNERYSQFPNFKNEETYNKFIDIIEHSNDDGSVGDIKLATIDLIFNNVCNFKCRSCGPGLSTSWVMDTIKLGNPINQNLLTNNKINHMNDDLVKLVEMVDPYTEVHFSGGEPMMQEEHYQFLQLLIDMGKTDIKIRYNTNLSVYTLKNYNAFEMLDKFTNVYIIGSVDAMSTQGEYIRKGFDWDKALDWIKTAKTYLPHIDFGISAVYSLLNAEAAIDLHKFICTDPLFTKENQEQFGFALNVLHEPYYMRTTVLPKETKERVSKKIDDHIAWLEQTQIRNFDYYNYIDHWNNAKILMNSKDETHYIPEFYEHTSKLDNIRDEKFADVFPELHKDLIKYVN